MERHTHEWIQNYEHYEAVLSCTHKISAWEKEQTLRAFQTWGFDDATTTGNDLSFIHVETGVIILHDGGVVAIQFSDGDVVKALADLFTVLNSLGWRKAEVFHRQETLDALLTDMGKAIPANLDFDVHPAKESTTSAENSSEARDMVELGVNLMQGVAANPHEAEQFNHVALAELTSMAQQDPLVNLAASGQASYAQIYEPLELEDGLDDLPVSLQSVSISHAPHAERIAFQDDDSSPMVPVLHASEQVGQSMQGQPIFQPVNVQEYSPNQVAQELHAENRMKPQKTSDDYDQLQPGLMQTLAPSVSVTQETTEDAPLSAISRDLEVEQEVLHQTGISALKSYPLGGLPTEHTIPQKAGQKTMVEPSLMKLGRSAFCFDLPDSPIEQSFLEHLAGDLNVSEVVHVWPGLTKQQERWDLLDEIDPAAPWSAENIADELKVLNPVERILFAGALKKAAIDGLQIRELLVALLDGDWIPEPLVKATQTMDSAAQAIFGKLGPLLLSDPGDAFLDTRLGTTGKDENNVIAPLNVISARAIALDPSAKLYVVHLDTCDGPFVQTLVSLMMKVTYRYSVSTRSIKLAEAQKARVELEENNRRKFQQQEAVQKTHQMFTVLLNHMKDAGLDMNQLNAMMTN